MSAWEILPLASERGPIFAIVASGDSPISGVAAAVKATAAGAAFIDKAAKEPGATKTTSGIVVTTTSVGQGAAPTANDQVKVHYEGRLINIHPSLLPAFTGLHTHQRAIDAGCSVAGATVHQVTAELDHGAYLAQAVVPVLVCDTAATLAARVLAQEHLIYPQAVRAFFASAPPDGDTPPG